MRKTALTIAGSDSCGGAGIQADIKTMTANGVYAMSAVTALTAQNTAGVTAILKVPPEFLGKQLDAVFTDIFPDAVKIGMVPSVGAARCIVERLAYYKAQNIVIDPVMAATAGEKLTSEDAISVLEEELFPRAVLLTPNIPEAELICGSKIESEKDMEEAAEAIGRKYRCAVLVKGGHRQENADDLLWQNGRCVWFCGKRIANPNTHGTGCTLSSAIAANLAKGSGPEEAVRRAKEYLSEALLAMLNLGKGNGPLDHGYKISET